MNRVDGLRQRSRNFAGTSQHAEKISRAVESGDAVRSAIAASWYRSLKLHGLEPDAETPRALQPAIDVQRSRDDLGELFDIASSAVDQLAASVRISGSCFMLSDNTGLVIGRRADGRDDGNYRRIGLWTGTRCAEDLIGTNAIGSCIIDERVTVIHGEDHFKTANSALNCIAAPIFGPLGELKMVLNLSLFDSSSLEIGPLAKMIVASTARNIESENFRRAYSASQITFAPNCAFDSGALIALDSAGILVGATRAARRMMRMSTGCLADVNSPMGWHLNDLSHSVSRAERATLTHALKAHDGNASQVARLLGISRSTLHRKMRRLNIARKDG